MKARWDRVVAEIQILFEEDGVRISRLEVYNGLVSIGKAAVNAREDPIGPYEGGDFSMTVGEWEEFCCKREEFVKELKEKNEKFKREAGD